MRPPRNAALQSMLRVLAFAYGAAVAARNRRYDRRTNVRCLALPVISVGNLTVGGTGKTPIVAWLAKHLQGQGRRPAVVSRGYRGRAGRGPLIVSDGSGPSCSSVVCGDEPFLLASTLAGVPIVVGADRVAGAEAAAALGAEVILLDDGFQHRGLARDLDLVLLDASNPFGNYALLPAGLLREPVAALGRANVILITRSRPDERFAVIERVVRHHNPQAPLLRAGHRALGFFDVRGRPVSAPRRALAFCAVGNPARFRMDLEREGLELVGFEARRDHHRLSRHQLSELVERAAAAGAALVTTEKDLARMHDFPFVAGTEPLVLRIEAVLYDPAPLVAALERVLEERA